MPGIALLDRRHAERALPLQNFSAKTDALLHIAAVRRGHGAFEIGHQLPGPIGRAGEVGERLPLGKTVFQQCFKPHALRADDGERHVDAVHRHKIDFLLPTRPIPHKGRIAERAVIHIDAVLLRHRITPLHRGNGQLLRHSNFTITAPG